MLKNYRVTFRVTSTSPPTVDIGSDGVAVFSNLRFVYQTCLFIISVLGVMSSASLCANDGFCELVLHFMKCGISCGNVLEPIMNSKGDNYEITYDLKTKKKKTYTLQFPLIYHIQIRFFT